MKHASCLKLSCVAAISLCLSGLTLSAQPHDRTHMCKRNHSCQDITAQASTQVKTKSINRLLQCPYTLNGSPDATDGWTFLPSAKGKSVYIPFEGYYASKGGRTKSPKIQLGNNATEGGFFRLRFTATAMTKGYWWIDLFDKNGNPLPDINSALYPTAKPQPYDEVFFADSRATHAAISFVSSKGVSIRDVSLTKITTNEAAAWCDNLYKTLPTLSLKATPNAFQRLPRTRDALLTGKSWKILLLGDSIVNDTWTSNFQSLVMRDFPQAKLTFILSVRGSTGCWYYQDPAHFNEYVARHKPDLVMIGGISNIPKKGTPDSAEKDMVSVIKQCQALGTEVIVMSPPPSREWRTSPEQTEWNENLTLPTDIKPFQRDYQQRAVAQTNVTFWDLTVAPCLAISQSKKPVNWFGRDVVHNNDRGKQLIGQTLAAWFRTALPHH